MQKSNYRPFNFLILSIATVIKGIKYNLRVDFNKITNVMFTRIFRKGILDTKGGK